MPHLLIRGLPVEQVRAVSIPLISELAALCECPEGDIMLECLHTTAVFQGETVPSYPFVEVAWFDRGTETRDRFAAIVDRHVRSLGVPEAEVAFRVYRKDHYYANGQRFGEPDEEGGEAALRLELQRANEANSRLRDQLNIAARKPQAAQSDSNMSSKLRDALRE